MDSNLQFVTASAVVLITSAVFVLHAPASIDEITAA